MTKGSAPTLSVSVDPATNRITRGGHTYDANGNLTAMSMLTMSYNVSNRLVSATHSVNGTDKYGYDPWGHRGTGTDGTFPVSAWDGRKLSENVLSPVITDAIDAWLKQDCPTTQKAPRRTR